MLTRAIRKEIASLATAKGRRRSGLFAAEGSKCVLDTLRAFECHRIYATQDWLEQHTDALGNRACEAVNRGELGELTSLSLAPDVIAIYRLPTAPVFDTSLTAGQLVLALDRVQDPGNLGTIMRTADWMGITTILASDDTVDCFNPKAIQATMGAVARVRVIYGDLPDMLRRAGTPVCGTFLDGDNIYTAPLPAEAVIVMGNEGSGISDDVARLVDRRLLIPSYPAGRPTSESLNVATATAIVTSQFIARRYGQG